MPFEHWKDNNRGFHDLITDSHEFPKEIDLKDFRQQNSYHLTIIW